jgi:hypothetical protein
MRLEIIETPDYILAVSDEGKKIENCYLYNTITKNIRKCFAIDKNRLVYNEFDFVIIAYRPKGNAKELDLPLLPEIVVEDDVEKLAEKEFPLLDTKWCRTGVVEEENLQLLGHRRSFIKGHKAATKKYSEEDLRKALNEKAIHFKIGYTKEFGVNGKYTKSDDEIIQSLKQPKTPKTPKWFVAETEDIFHSPSPIGMSVDTVLKTTTTNGKTYLVGTYLNE